jgi:hypothetical protein
MQSLLFRTNLHATFIGEAERQLFSLNSTKMSLLRGSQLTRGNTQLTEGKNMRALFSKDTTEKGLTSFSQSVNIQQSQGSNDW